MERVDGFELVVRDGHPQQRVEVVVGVDEPLPLRELLADQVGALGWRVDDLTSGRVGDAGPSTLSLNVLESERKLNTFRECVT